MRIVRLCALALTTMATTAAYTATVTLFAEHRQPLLITYAIAAATVLLLTTLAAIGWVAGTSRRSTPAAGAVGVPTPGWVAASRERPLAGVARERPEDPVEGSSYDTLGLPHYLDPAQQRCANPRCAQPWPCEVATTQATMRRSGVPQTVPVG